MEPNEYQFNKEALFIEENQKAENFIEAEDLRSAAKILVDVVQHDPNNWRAYNNLGIISWSKSAWEDAYTMFKHAAELNPSYTDALMNLFDASLKLKRVPEALPVFKAGLAVNPDDEEVKIIVESIETQGDEIYRSERALGIGVYNPRIEEANHLLEDGKINLAMEKYLEIHDTEGPSASVFSGLGIIAYYQKRFKDSFTLFYEAIKLNPADTDTYLNFLDAAKECGLDNDAKKIFEVYCKEFPLLKKIADEFE